MISGNLSEFHKLISETDAREEAERRILEAHDHANEVRARCQTLAGFIAEAWHVLEPNATYVHSWHIDAICMHLEAVTDGRINRLLINVPPGSMKSLIVSVFWPAWEWSVRGLRSLRYLSTAFNDGPVKRDTRKTRDLILSEWYQTLWPEVRLTRTGETSFANADTGTREGVAFGSLTSQRGDRLIIDDPHSTDTAESDVEREATSRRFREGAQNRLNDQARSAIVVIMQRLHQGDVSGVIHDLQLPYVHLMIPMEFETARRCVTRLGPPPPEGEPDERPIFWQDPRTQEDELMDPVRFSRAELDKLYVPLGEYGRAGQYQQRPAPREGGLFKVEKIEVVQSAPAGRAVRGWDIAGSKRKTSPYTAGVRLKRGQDGYLYVEDARRKRESILIAEQMIVATAGEDGTAILQSIPQDPGSAGLSQKAHLADQLGGYTFRFSTETGDKVARANPIAAQVEAGMVRIVAGAWNAEFIDELRNFPASTYKDQVDALSRAYGELVGTRGETMGGAPQEVTSSSGSGIADDDDYDVVTDEDEYNEEWA